MTSSIPLVHAVRDDTLLEVFTYYIVFYFTGLLVILSSPDSKNAFVTAHSLGNKKDPSFFLIKIFYSNIIYDHTIVLQIQEVWDDIRVLLRRNLLWQMSAYSPLKAEPGDISTMSSPEQVKCLQQLFFLYPESEALMHYQVRYKCVKNRKYFSSFTGLCNKDPKYTSGFRIIHLFSFSSV